MIDTDGTNISPQQHQSKNCQQSDSDREDRKYELEGDIVSHTTNNTNSMPNSYVLCNFYFYCVLYKTGSY